MISVISALFLTFLRGFEPNPALNQEVGLSGSRGLMSINIPVSNSPYPGISPVSLLVEEQG